MAGSRPRHGRAADARPACPVASGRAGAAHGGRAPVAAPSANPSGRVSPTTAGTWRTISATPWHSCSTAAPARSGSRAPSSTFPRRRAPGCCGRAARSRRPRAITGPLRLRPGRGSTTCAGPAREPLRPRLPVRLDATDVSRDEALLAFGPPARSGARAGLNLSPPGDLEEAARNLFQMLRRLDRAARRASRSCRSRRRASARRSAIACAGPRAALLKDPQGRQNGLDASR